MAHTLKLLAEKFEQVIKRQQLTEGHLEDKVLQAANEYVKSMGKWPGNVPVTTPGGKHLVAQYLSKPENIYNIAWELTHDDMVSDSGMMDDDMADAELDSDEVAEKACEGIAEFMGGAHAFNLVYDIARPHMPT
jgi:hypothetical protein